MAIFELQPFDKFTKSSNQNLEMSCDVFKSLLCKNVFHSWNILSPTLNFSSLVQSAFCTTTHLNISSWPPPKLWDIVSSIWFNFMQKPSDVLWKNWVYQPLLHSGPTGWIVLQLYFNLLLLLWTLSPRGWTHWSTLGSWNYALFLLSRTGVLQNLH